MQSHARRIVPEAGAGKYARRHGACAAHLLLGSGVACDPIRARLLPRSGAGCSQRRWSCRRHRAQGSVRARRARTACSGKNAPPHDEHNQVVLRTSTSIQLAGVGMRECLCLRAVDRKLLFNLKMDITHRIPGRRRAAATRGTGVPASARSDASRGSVLMAFSSTARVDESAGRRDDSGHRELGVFCGTKSL